MSQKIRNFVKSILYVGLVSSTLLTGCGNEKEREESEKNRQEKLEYLEQRRKERKNILQTIKEQDSEMGYITGEVFYKEKGDSLGHLSGSYTGGLEGKFSGSFLGIHGSIRDESKGSIDGSSGKGVYFFGIITDKNKPIGLTVVDSKDKTAGSIAALVEKSPRIRFPAGNLKSAESWPAHYYLEETCFNEKTQIGTKRADRIEVLY